MIEKFGHVEADQCRSRKSRDDAIARIVEYPGVVAAVRLAPARKPRMQALGIGGIKNSTSRESRRAAGSSDNVPRSA